MAKLRKRSISKLHIGVLMGGLSSEREISLVTGKAIYSELKNHGHKVTAIDINSRSIAKILRARPDVVINGLHGTYGEDGVMQGILDFLNIPYTGSDLTSSAIAMNKVRTKQVLGYHGVKVPKWSITEKFTDIKKTGIKIPFVLKPEAEGSAVGVFIVKTNAGAKTAFNRVKKLSKKVLVEEYIKGKEISVPVLGKRPLPIIEIRPLNEFYDYDAKYTPGKSTHVIPAKIAGKIYRQAEKTAVLVHEALGCRDLSRIDMIVRGNTPYVLEANTLPGMTSVSLFPESAKAAGISFYELIMRFVRMAYARRTS